MKMSLRLTASSVLALIMWATNSQGTKCSLSQN